MSPLTPPSRMSSPHPLGNFRFLEPLDDIGFPRQIAYYSHFPGTTNEYGYQSRKALRVFQLPDTPFPLTSGTDEPTFLQMCGRLDSPPQPGLKPVTTSCKQAGCEDDLVKASVITRRGVVLEYACSLVLLTAS